MEILISLLIILDLVLVFGFLKLHQIVEELIEGSIEQQMAFRDAIKILRKQNKD